MIEWVLDKIICKTYENEIHQAPEKFGDRNRNAMLLRIGLFHRDQTSDDDRYSTLFLLITGEMRYIGVYSAVGKGRDLPSFDKFKCITHHDSCWRDGVRNVIFDNSHEMNTLLDQFNEKTWYTKLVLNDEQLEALRVLRKRNVE